MNHLYFYILLVLNFQTISGQACSSETPCSVGEICRNKVCKDACDNSSDTTQCSEGEICRNNPCEDALNCLEDSNLCLTTPGLFCVSDYCQPNPCTSTGQCVHGHVCSQDAVRKCVYPVVANVEESSKHTFAFKEPATPGNYDEIQWYKGNRSSLARVAVIHPIITDNKTQYYNEFCSGKSPCRTSDRALLNTDTGELTIDSVKFLDEGFYYYQFFITDGLTDTGVKYEYKLNVYVTGNLTIEGLPDEYVEVGTNHAFTCTIDRIRPGPIEMYWVINGINVTDAITTRDVDGDGVFNQTSTYIHNVTKEDEKIVCVVVPVYGNPVSTETVINPGSGGGGGGNVALIGGAIGGILFIILIIIIVVFITRRKNKPKAPDCEPKQLVQNGVHQEPVYAQPNKSRKLRPQRGLDEGPQYANTEQLQGENPYENTGVDNNNPPTKQNGTIPPELIYIEVDVGKKDAKANGNKPVPKERSSMRKPKINRSDDPTMYAEIQPKA